VVKYKDIQKPILTIDEAIEANSFHQCFFGTATVGTPDGECCHLFLWEEANVCQDGSPDSDPNLWQSVVSYLFVNVCQGSQKFRAIRYMWLFVDSK